MPQLTRPRPHVLLAPGAGRRVNLAQLPLEWLPPLAVDGNLHTCYTMHANKHGLPEPEDVLEGVMRHGRPAVETSPALLCVRRWLSRMEVDVREWGAKALAPLCDALKYNTKVR